MPCRDLFGQLLYCPVAQRCEFFDVESIKIYFCHARLLFFFSNREGVRATRTVRVLSTTNSYAARFR